ncbi:MAG: TIGR02147 family protein [Deltaproteobacteria bacterium]|nr:TIGR02147 family protein [Deltaproteobacteria bacterium]
MTSVYQFTDYRTFLQSYAEDKKKVNPNWSYGVWAQKLGMSGTAALTMIINGQRHPGNKALVLFQKYFDFSQNESEYFFDLVRLKKIKNDPRLSILLMEKMSQYHPDGKFKLLDQDTFNAISYWYYYAIRGMTQMSQFKEDPQWIVKKLNFKVTPLQVKKAIQTLLKLKLLERDEKGILKPVQKDIDTTKDIANEAIKRFHEQISDLSKASIRKISVQDREFNTTTLLLKKNNLPKAKELIRKFQKDFSRLLEEDKGDAIYQLNVQLFPLTKTDINGRSKNNEN